MTFRIAREQRLPVYECLAQPSTRSKTIVEHLANANDDITDRIPMKLLFYVGMPVMLSRKHPTLIEADIIANGVIGSIIGMYPPPEKLSMVTYTVDSVKIQKFVQRPELLLIKLHDCHSTLVDGFPEGVIGLPPLHAQVHLKKIPNLSQASVTVDQFAVVPAFACTTEKLQGKTCHDGIIVTPLDRRHKGVPSQTLYVALSRAVRLSGLTLTEPITREYLEKFKPTEATANEMRRLIDRIVLPPYVSPTEARLFEEWKSSQRT